MYQPEQYSNEETDMGPLDEEAMTAAPEPGGDGPLEDAAAEQGDPVKVGDAFEDLESEDGPDDSPGDEEE